MPSPEADLEGPRHAGRRPVHVPGPVERAGRCRVRAGHDHGDVPGLHASRTPRRRDRGHGDRRRGSGGRGASSSAHRSASDARSPAPAVRGGVRRVGRGPGPLGPQRHPARLRVSQGGRRDPDCRRPISDAGPRARAAPRRASTHGRTRRLEAGLAVAGSGRSRAASVRAPGRALPGGGPVSRRCSCPDAPARRTGDDGRRERRGDQRAAASRRFQEPRPIARLPSVCLA